MSLTVLGISHQTAPVEVRERFAVAGPERRALIGRLVASGAEEAVVLSTCNRTELYLRERDGCGAARAAVELLGAQAGWSGDEVRRHLTLWRESEAARHLFRVASGLDSAVLGEAQIQGQVRDAYEAAHAEAQAVGPVLSRMFQASLSVGARVRSETALGRGAASVPGAAVELARKVLGSLEGKRALIVGAGAMSRLALKCLAGEGVVEPVVVSRTRGRAEELAADFGGRAIEAGSLAGALDAVDLVVTATSAPHVVLTRAQLEPASRGRTRRPLVVADLALPRDVDAAAGGLPGVFLFDVDDLRGLVDENVERRRADVPLAEAIVDDAVAGFWRWYSARHAADLIRTIRDQAEEVRRREVARALRGLGHLDPEDLRRIEELSERILNKVLHPPTVRLRGAAGEAKAAPVMEAARYLFGVEGAAAG